MSRGPARTARSPGASPRHRPRVAALSRAAPKRKPGVPGHSHQAAPPLPPISLGGYPFPLLTTQWTTLPHQAGLFAILEREPTAEAYRPLVLDEAADMHAALATLSRRFALPKASTRSGLVYAAVVTHVVRAARQHIVTTLRTRYQLATPLAPLLLPGGYGLWLL